jgi:molybdate transport system substrate-binding protein
MTEGSAARGRAAGGRPRHAAGPAAGARSSRGRRSLWRGFLIAVLLAATLAVAACGGSSGGGSSGGDVTLHVLAASSLTEAFTKLGAQCEADHPGVKVVFDFAGSQDLVAQLRQGAPADVLACADTSTMDSVADLVGSPRTFAGNTLAIIVPPGNPKQVGSLADLADPSAKVVLAAPEVPAGKYSQQILDQAGVTVESVSLEESVKGVVTKISLDEADAGIVYVTDVAAARGKVEGVTIPADQNVTAIYLIATVTASGQGADAQDFVALVLSPAGQKTLKDFGFLSPPGS